MTASEPLSLEEEFRMCDEWRSDPHSAFAAANFVGSASVHDATSRSGNAVNHMAECTFIMFDKEAVEDGNLVSGGCTQVPPISPSPRLACSRFLLPFSIYTGMAGDVNLFFTAEEDHSVAEIMVMTAEPSCRRRGCAREAVQLMMRYGAGRRLFPC